MLDKKTIEDIDLYQKKVLVRCDFNVPLDKENINIITDDTRIVESLKTIQYLLEKDCKIILCSHIGKHKDNLSLKPVQKRLEELLNKKVIFATDAMGCETKHIIDNMNYGEIVLLENLRKYEEEEENDEQFSKTLASYAEVFVNDAFGTAHRAHASTEGVTKFLPSVAGFLIEKELLALDKGINSPVRPLVAIVGGAKVSSKIDVLKSLIEKVDVLLIGGGMAYTFIKALGGNIGKSLCEMDKLESAKEILDYAKKKNVKIVLPVDTIAADNFSNNANIKKVDIYNIPDNLEGMDIGEKTIELFKEEIKKAGTVVLNGPVGVFEFDNFAKGSYEIIKAISESKAVSIIGGGDSAACVKKFGLDEKMTHVSTGGGASLEFMEGKTLPGIAALMDK